MSRKYIKLKAILTLAVFYAIQTAQAGGYATSTISSVRVDADGRGLIEFVQPIGGTPPSCVASGFNTMMAFNASTAGGKAILANALAAKATGAQVIVAGAGTCTNYSNVMEDVAYLLQR